MIDTSKYIKDSSDPFWDDVFKYATEYHEGYRSKLIKKYNEYQVSTFGSGQVFLHRSWRGLRSSTNYSGYRSIHASDLIGRVFEITGWDYSPGVKFLDSIHDERTNTEIRFPFI